MIQSVQRAMRILSVLGDSYDAPVTLTLIGQKTGLPVPTCAHIVSTLEEEGYALKVSRAKGYVLGPAAYYLSRFGRYKTDLISVCRPVMQYLHRNLGRAVILAVIEGGAKYVIDYVDDGKSFHTKEQIRMDYVYRTATGRAILLNLSAERMYELFQKLGTPLEDDWPEVRDFEDLKILAAKAGKNDVQKVVHLNRTTGMLEVGYGTALFDDSGCVGAIGIAVGIYPEEEKAFLEEEKRFYRLLKYSGKEITKKLSEEA